MNRSDEQEITARLEKLAFKKTAPFCVGCHCQAPTGRCERCGSDDLARELASEGMDWGVAWVIPILLRDALTPVDTEAAFEDSIRECYPETTKVAWLELDTCSIAKELDPVSWDLAQAEWIDAELCDGNLITFDNGSTYYWTYEVEKFLDESETDEDAA